MNSVLLLTLFDSFDIPLSEAGRKQAWWMANELKANSNVDIYYSSGVRSTIHVGGVRIFSGNLSSREMSKYDENNLQD